MRTTVAAILLWSLTGCATTSGIDRVKEYRAARTRGDAASEQAFLAPGARMYFDTREGPGEPLTAGRTGRWAHWDDFFHSRTIFTDWSEGDGIVSAVAHETNDFYRLLEWEPNPYRMTWRLDREGRIRDALLEAIPAETNSLMPEFKEWASRKHPEELEYLMPNGRIDPTGDRPERFQTILREWRQDAGLDR